MSSTRLASRTILHMDLDAFYCSVEEQRDPTLQGQAFAVGGRPENRGVVASCSYAARQMGVHSAMSMSQALRHCPSLRIVPPRHSEYRAVSNRVMALLRRGTPLVEQLSIDEAFLDVTALLEADAPSSDTNSRPTWTSHTLALVLQKRIFKELGLSCSLGVASNKMVAKIATDCGKAAVGTGQSPHALCVVPPGEEAAFLAPLPVTALWGVGPKTAQQLMALGISTIGDLARWPQRDLLNRFGRHGFELSQHAQGIDKREVVTERESKSISSETTFVRDVQDWETLFATLREQAQSVSDDLEAQKLQASTVKIKLRWTDFSITTRQTTLPSPTCAAKVIEETATVLLKQHWEDEAPVRLLGVGVSGFSQVRQLSLWNSDSEFSSPPAPAEALTDVETFPDGAVSEQPTESEIIPAEKAPYDAVSIPDQFPVISHEKKQQLLQDTLAALQQQFGYPVFQAAKRLRQEPLDADLAQPDL